MLEHGRLCRPGLDRDQTEVSDLLLVLFDHSQVVRESLRRWNPFFIVSSPSSLTPSSPIAAPFNAQLYPDSTLYPHYPIIVLLYKNTYLLIFILGKYILRKHNRSTRTTPASRRYLYFVHRHFERMGWEMHGVVENGRSSEQLGDTEWDEDQVVPFTTFHGRLVNPRYLGKATEAFEDGENLPHSEGRMAGDGKVREGRGFWNLPSEIREMIYDDASEGVHKPF